MPKYPVEYGNSIIYKITTAVDTPVFIGVTTNLYNTKYHMKQQIKENQTYRPLIKWIINNDCKYEITVIEKYTCCNKTQAVNRALYHVNMLRNEGAKVDTSLLTCTRFYKHHISKTCKHNNNTRACPICKPINHISNLVRTNVNKAMKYNHIKCPERSLNILGCSIEDFVKHIEDQFSLPCNAGMTWDNRHLWDIDHIIGINTRINGVAPNMMDILQRLHYTNTQPMWKTDNIKKSNNVNMLDVYRNDKQIINFKEFWKLVE